MTRRHGMQPFLEAFELVGFARAAVTTLGTLDLLVMAEIADLDRLADQRAVRTLRRIAGVEQLLVGDPCSEHLAGAMAALRCLVLRAGRLVTGATILAEVEAELYAWARLAGLVPVVMAEGDKQ